MTRLYGGRQDRQRIHEATPGGRWKIMTILGAMSLRGMVATMTIEPKSGSCPHAGDVKLFAHNGIQATPFQP
jgi:hypothetical protein